MGLLFTSQIDVAIDKATSELLPNAQEDLAASMEVCDMVKGKRVGAREAMRSLKRRLLHRNPNVQMLTLKLTDLCVKNTGNHFLLELASREFVDTLSSLCRSNEVADEVNRMVKEHLQIWALLLKDESGMGYLYEVYQELLRSGLKFPPPPRNLNKSLTTTSAPPEWIDGSQCVRCRVQFTLTLRKHHCRNCGQVFCQDCSSKSVSLPEFGIPDPVRICESCYVRRIEQKSLYQKSVPLPVTPPNMSPPPSEEDPDLALAMRLSLQESQHRSAAISHSIPDQHVHHVPGNQEEEEAMMRAALAASLQPASINHPVTPIVVPSIVEETVFVSEMDRENAKLFSQLVDKLSLSGTPMIEPEIEALALSMEALRSSIKSQGKMNSPEIAGVLATLEIALAKYQLLKQMPRPAVQNHTNPSPSPQPIGYPVYHSQNSYALAPNYPAYGHSTMQQPSMPNAYPEPESTGQLLDDEPLIKL